MDKSKLIESPKFSTGDIVLAKIEKDLGIDVFLREREIKKILTARNNKVAVDKNSKNGRILAKVVDVWSFSGEYHYEVEIYYLTKNGDFKSKYLFTFCQSLLQTNIKDEDILFLKASLGL